MRKNSNNDDQLSEHSLRCGLGINKKTGRLQWCPGYCNLHRMLIVIPATMVPLCIIFLLFTHLELVGTVRHEKQQKPNFPSIVDDGAKEIVPPSDTICKTVRIGQSETLETEERDLLKDIRTSFIPPELVVVPPNCRPNDDDSSDTDWDMGSDTGNVNDIVDVQKDQIAEFLRRKRAEIDNQTKYDELLESVEILENDADDMDDDDIDKPPWKTSTDCEFPINTELDADEMSNKKPNCRTAQKTLVPFHAFWKGEGTAEKIRATQAEIMKQYMDPTVDPCDDFYQYACGNWEKLNPIPKDKAAYDTFEMLRESLDSVLQDLLLENKTKSNEMAKIRLKRQILEKRKKLNQLMQNYLKYRRKKRHSPSIHLRTSNTESNDNDNDEDDDDGNNDAEQKAKDLYESCMNYALIEKRGIKPLLELLKNLGGWPVLDDTWREENFDWLNLTARLRLYNNDIFLAEWVGPDIKNSEENIIQFDQTSLGLPTRDYFLQASNQQYLDAYEVYMHTIITLLGSNLTNANRVSKEIVKFEVELARITSSPEERTNVSVLYKRMSLGTLHQLIPQINWVRYLMIILERPVNSSEMIVMFATNYMQELVKLLSTTEKRTISNYLLWRFVRHRINNLDDRFQDAKQKFYKVLFGREQSPPRWKNCVSQVNSNMGMAVGAMFVQKYFDENSKKDTLTMTYELQQAFREILNNTEWIETSTKLLAELKVNAMSLKIGYPDYILNSKELNDKYKDLDIDSSKYFENTLNVLVHLTRNEQSKLGEMVNKTVWHTAPAVVNAYYSRNKNQIMFPAGILQPPFYHRHFPRSLNYGGIGVVIGHELTHGFDDKGRLFDRDGNLHRWWTDSDIDGFHERATCLIAQYSNYTVTEVGITVDGENTQGENIADNGGIKQAFRAYSKWLMEHDDAESLEKEVLPGINATPKQLFFLNFAQVWCGAMRPEATRNKLKTAVHSPGKFRVIGTLSNSDDFAQVYNCPFGSSMNPIDKCSVW